MITFQNKMSYSMKINIDGEPIIIDEYGEYKYNNLTESVDFTVEEDIPHKTKPLAYLFLALVGFIMFIFEFYDSEYLNFRKYLSFPVKAHITDINNDITVILNEPRSSNIKCCNIVATENLEYEAIIDKESVLKQYKQFQKESFAVLFVPLLLVVAFCAFLIASKQVVGYAVGAAIIAIIVAIWIRLHNKNKSVINDILN